MISFTDFAKIASKQKSHKNFLLLYKQILRYSTEKKTCKYIFLREGALRKDHSTARTYSKHPTVNDKYEVVIIYRHAHIYVIKKINMC